MGIREQAVLLCRVLLNPWVHVQVYQEYGLPESQRMAVFIYGGQPPGEWHLREECLPEGWTCIVCAAGSPPGGEPLPPNFILAPADAYTPDLVRPFDLNI